MILSWLVSLAAHIGFRRGLSAEQTSSLAMRSPMGIWGSILGLIVVTGIVLKGWYDSRVNLFSGLAYLVLLTIAYYVIKSQRRKAQ
jgi:L-asparagine transporter-like permease